MERSRRRWIRATFSGDIRALRVSASVLNANRNIGSILKPGGEYRYLCTFPGHNALMRGTLKFG